MRTGYIDVSSRITVRLTPDDKTTVTDESLSQIEDLIYEELVKGYDSVDVDSVSGGDGEVEAVFYGYQSCKYSYSPATRYEPAEIDVEGEIFEDDITIEIPGYVTDRINVEIISEEEAA